MKVTRSDVGAAAARIRPHLRRTPVLHVAGRDLGLRGDVHLKLDSLQVTGSFKPRGAYNLLLSRDVPAAGVVAASGGNFGLAIAHAARALGHRAAVFVPATSPRAKIDRLGALDADVHVIDGYYDDALAASEEHLAATGALRAHAYDLPEVVAGQGTCAAEFEQQIGGLDVLLVAVGGGGLVAGTAASCGDRVRIVAVETEGTPTLHAARAAGRPVDVDVGGLAASSLGARRLGDHAWAANHAIAQAVLVSDDDVREAQYRLWEACRLVAEPGGAAALAALTSRAVRPDPGARVGVIVCGANTAPTDVVR